MRKLFALILLTLLVAGCGGTGGTPDPVTSGETATAAAEATQTHAGPQTPTNTFTPEPTQGPSPTPQPTPTSSPTSGPTPTGGAKWVTFSIVRRVLGAYESNGIYRMAVDGSELDLIVEEGYTLLGVSPSGLRMLVSSGQSLFVMGIDASNQRLLSESYYNLGMSGAYWTSDEHKIVFIDGDGTNNVLWVGHPDTSDVERISPEDLNPIEVYPSLDASGILWSAGSCRSQGDCNREELLWSAIDGTQQDTLPEDISHPQAASTGDRIVYTTHDDQNRLRMETAAMNGAQADAVFVFGNHFMDYAWSPAGDSLAIIVTDRSDYSGILTGHRYYVVGLPGGDVHELPWSLGAQSNISWSPDGYQLILSGTDQTDTGYQITMKTYDLLQEQQHDLPSWEVFSSLDYMFIPRIYWIP
jgi:hypothetical protein